MSKLSMMGVDNRVGCESAGTLIKKRVTTMAVGARVCCELLSKMTHLAFGIHFAHEEFINLCTVLYVDFNLLECNGICSFRVFG